MFPQLISWGPLHLSTLTACLTLGFLMSVFLFWRRTHDDHFEDDLVFDMVLLSILAGVVGGRLGFIAIHFKDFWSDPWRWINMFSYPGIWEVSALIVGMIVVRHWSNRQKWEPFELLDYASVSLSVFLAWWWLGRFLIGSYLGKPTNFLGVTFPTIFDARHPVQIYLAIGFVVLYGVLKWFETRYRFLPWYRGHKQTAEPGFLFGVFWIGYGLLNSLSLLLRPAEIIVYDLSLDGVLYFLCVVFGMVTIYRQIPKKGYKAKSVKKLTLQSRSKLFMSRWRRTWKRKS